MDFYQLMSYSWNVNSRNFTYLQFYIAVLLAAFGWLVQMKSKFSRFPTIVITSIMICYFSFTYAAIESCYLRNHEINEEIKANVDAQKFSNKNLAEMLKSNHALSAWRTFRIPMLSIDILLISFIIYRSKWIDSRIFSIFYRSSSKRFRSDIKKTDMRKARRRSRAKAKNIYSR
jgi:hypothetical protein